MTIPITAFAAECVHDEISAEQQASLDQQNLEIRVPQGEVGVIQRCDTSGDNVVDRVDILNISLARNQPIRHPDDPWDWDRNGIINIVDARGCQRLCALSRCAPMPPQPEPVGGVIEATKFSKLQDLDGDGSQDFVGIFENSGEVDLSPGKITLENLGIVTYGYNNPEVLCYWVDGELRRAFYNVDD